MTEERLTAVVVDGPDWWADPSTMPDGSPVPYELAAVVAVRREEAEAEWEALRAAVAALPQGCLVMHTAGRGAAALAAADADRLGLPQTAWPSAADRVSIAARDRALVAALVGLRDAGWLVKALLAGNSGDAPRLADLLCRERVYVHVVTR